MSVIDATTETETRVIEASTCLGCGCLCDDIRVEVAGGRVVEAARACPIGRAWFLADRPGAGHPAATVDGGAVGFVLAVGRAAEILGRAKAPVVWGLAGSTIEGQRAAVAVADAIGAVVDVAGPGGRGDGLRAFQRAGRVSGTLGEVRDRADLVVFWGVDPVATHPRHLDRYSVGPRGRFVPEGRAGRSVVVIDHRGTATAAVADHHVPIGPDRRGEALWVLRALVRGVTLDPARAEAATGVSFPSLEDLAGRLARARYGAFFFDEGQGGPWAAEGALTLVRDLNAPGRRFVALSLGAGGNAAGAESVLAWQAGAPAAVDFGSGTPRHRPGDATLADRMAQGAVDAVLIVADDPAATLPPDALARLASIPCIRVAPGATAPTARPAVVAFDVARPGIETGGTVARVDGVMLPLRRSIAVDLPTDREVLESIGGQLRNGFR